MNTASKVVLVVALLAVLSFSASAQTGLGGIGPAGAQVAGGAVGLAAVTGLVLYLTLHKPSITGCVVTGNGTNTLPDKNHHLEYTLVGATSEIKAGERVRLQGKKKKDKEGNLTFQVKKLKRDFGPCQP